jgi:hypothetical protein
MRLAQYAELVLVRCPACDRCARVFCRREGNRYPDKPRLTCTRCGLTRETAHPAYQYGVPVDPFFGLPLWLQTRCCGETLWALNLDHLNVLESYVGARLREKKPNSAYTMLEVLPRWMKAAGHRAEFLRATARLRESLTT